MKTTVNNYEKLLIDYQNRQNIEDADEVGFSPVLTEKIHVGRFNIELSTLKTKTGKYSPYSIVRMRKGVVCVIRHNGKYIVERQFRPALNQFTFEAVAGMVNKDELVGDAARREILEETGLNVSSLTPMGITHSTPGSADEEASLFLADVDDVFNEQTLDLTERIYLYEVTAEELKDLLDKNIITHAASCIAYMKALEIEANIKKW